MSNKIVGADTTTGELPAVVEDRISDTIDAAVDVEAALARNADNLTSGTVADARIASTIARDSEVTSAVSAEATLARNADNLTSGTVADARIASTIARDSEVSSAVAAEATLARNADNLTSGTVADARIASTIARDSEVTALTDALDGRLDTAEGTLDALPATYVTPAKVRAGRMLTVGFDDGADYKVSDYASADLAVAAAIAALPAAGGGLLLKAGTYNFAAGVSVDEYTVLTGEGMNTVIRWATGTAPADGSYLFTLADFSIVENLRFDGNSGTNANGGGIYIFEGARVWLNKLYVASFGKDGIRFKGTDANNSAHADKFTDLFIRDCGRYGIYGEGAFTYDSQFDNVWVGVCNVGIKTDSGSSFFNNVHVWGCVSDGIQAQEGTKMSNVYAESNGGWGINAAGSIGGLALAGGDIWNNGLGGILLGAGTDRSAISALVVRGNTGPGIEIRSSFCTVTSSAFYDLKGTKTQTYPVLITGSAASNLVSDCTGRGTDHLTGTFASTSSSLTNVFENCIGLNPRGFSSLGSRDGSATVTFDRRDGETFYATLTGNWGTVVLQGAAGLTRGMAMTLVLTQDATGGRTITWPSNFKPAGGALVIAPTPSVTSTIRMVLDSNGDWQEVSRSIGNGSTVTPIDGTLRSTLASDTPFTNNTLATILSTAIGASQTWRIKGLLIVEGGQTGDLKLRLQATGATGATGWLALAMQAAGSASSTSAVSGNPVTAVALAVSGGSTLAIGTVGVGSFQAIYVDGFVTTSTTPGTLDLQAAQNTTDATALNIKAGSYMHATRVA